MITKPAAFRITGAEPAPKGSLAGRCLTHPEVGEIARLPQRVVMSEGANRGRPWRRVIEAAAPVHITERAGKHQPLKVTMLFAVTRTPAAELRLYPSTQSAQGIGGDLDKMVRLVLDALQSCGVLTNDAQVVAVEAAKVYAEDAAWLARGGKAGFPGLYCRLEPANIPDPPLPLEEL
jgi:Holliday junction resolvase RusA-like endonuclease